MSSYNYKKIYRRALDVAEIIHAGQTRWDGTPYISHPLAVAESFETNFKFKTVAILHDCIEDCEEGPDRAIEIMREYTIPKDIIDIVLILTRKKPTESYANFICRVVNSRNDIAIEVKKADLKHNLSDLKRGAMRDKYELALVLLG